MIGHVEWATHGRLDERLGTGAIVHLRDAYEEPAGGGGVAARVLPGLGAGESRFYTALADDPEGRESARRMRAEGVEVLAAARSGRQNRVLVTVDEDGERTIYVLGENQHPRIVDPLPWEDLGGFDAVFFTGGDPETLRAARRARVLVVTARRLASLVESGVEADVLIGSGSDPSERIDIGALPVRPGVIAVSEGLEGGRYLRADGSQGRWSAAPLPGPLVDTYGAGDSFMAGLTLALGRGDELDEALAFAARASALQLTRRGGSGAPPP